MDKKSKIVNKRNALLAVIVIVICAAGLIHTFVGGGWSKSTGEAAKLFPRIIYVVLMVVSICLLIIELLGRGKEEPPAIPQVKWWQVLLMLAAGVIFFEFVLNVGVGVGIFIYLEVMISLFDEDPKKNWKMDLLIAFLASVVLFVIFTRVLPIITLNQVLF